VTTIKVDGVRSAQEAVTLETLGADLIGVALSPNPRSPGTPMLTEAQAATIAGALTDAALYTGSWAFLRDESPEFAAEFQIADLDALGRERPLVVGLDFTAGNVREIVAALSRVRGIAVTRGDAVRVLGAVGG
jgi:hypothetical protein